jgi:hypothetical protein
MKKLGIPVVIVWVVALFAAAPTPGQQSEPDATPTRLALEVVSHKDFPPAYHPVPGPDCEFDGAWFFRFGRIASWRPPTSSFPVRSVRVVSRVESGRVRVVVSVQRGARFNDSQDFVADYIANEGEKTSIQTLKQYGVEPFQITLVRITPTIASPPIVSNQTKSIEVVSIEASNSTTPGYTLVLKNSSARTLKAFALRMSDNGKEILQAQPQNPEGQPMITAGGFFRTEPLGGRGAVLTPAGYQPYAPANPQIVITAAVFDDNSFEGEAAAASMIVGRDQGRTVQLQRVVSILTSAARSEDVDLNNTLLMLRERVSALTDQIPESVSTQLIKDFPTMAHPSLQSSLEAGAHLIKNQVLADIAAFERTQQRSIEQRVFWKWLRATLDKYEAWLSRLTRTSIAIHIVARAHPG